MSNWEYGKIVPTKQFRSAFSIPRIFKIVECPCNHENYLLSFPLPEFVAKFTKTSDKITPACFVDLNLTGVTAREVRVTLKNEHEEVVMLYDREGKGTFYFDRGVKSGRHSFCQTFPAVTHAHCHVKDRYNLKIFIDKHSVEVFDGDGVFSMTTTVFPRHPYTELVVEPVDGECQSSFTVKTI